MADNFTANPGSGGSVFAADDIAGVLTPRVKNQWGADGTCTDTSVAAPMPVQIIPLATGIGATPYNLISAASTNATSVKGSAGTLLGIQVININAAVRYLKFYNKATAPTVGSDTPVYTFTIPGATTGAGFVWPIPTAFATGIAFAVTTGSALADTGAVAAGDIVVNLAYV